MALVASCGPGVPPDAGADVASDAPGEAMSCTRVGCGEFTLEVRDGRGTLLADFGGALLSGTTRVRPFACAAGAGSGSGFACEGAGRVRFSGPTTGTTAVSVTTSREMVHDLGVVAEAFRPNGPGCEPVCYRNARVTQPD